MEANLIVEPSPLAVMVKLDDKVAAMKPRALLKAAQDLNGQEGWTRFELYACLARIKQGVKDKAAAYKDFDSWEQYVSQELKGRSLATVDNSIRVYELAKEKQIPFPLIQDIGVAKLNALVKVLTQENAAQYVEKVAEMTVEEVKLLPEVQATKDPVAVAKGKAAAAAKAKGVAVKPHATEIQNGDKAPPAKVEEATGAEQIVMPKVDFAALGASINVEDLAALLKAVPDAKLLGAAIIKSGRKMAMKMEIDKTLGKAAPSAAPAA